MEVFHVSLNQLTSLSEICSKLTAKIPVWCYWRRFGVLIRNLEQILHILLVFSIFDVEQGNASWVNNSCFGYFLRKYHHEFHFYLANSGITAGFHLQISRIQEQFNSLLLIRAMHQSQVPNKRRGQNKWGVRNFKISVNISNEWKMRHKCLILTLNLKVSK